MLLAPDPLTPRWRRKKLLNLFGSLTGFHRVCLFHYGFLGCKGFMKQTLTTRSKRFTTKIICKHPQSACNAGVTGINAFEATVSCYFVSRSNHDMHENRRHDTAKDIHRIYRKTSHNLGDNLLKPLLRPDLSQDS